MDTNDQFIRAEQLLSNAKEEMMHPEADLVPYSICQKCYYSIVNYLNVYLHNRGVRIEENTDVGDLLKLAALYDKKFNEIDRSFLKYPKETEDVWMNVDRAKDFIRLTERTREIIGVKKTT